MRFRRNLVVCCSVAIAIALTATGEVRAQTFCYNAPAAVRDGGEFSGTMKTVVSSVKRPGLQSAWCVHNWQSIGAMYRPFEIIQKPRLGRAQIQSTYGVAYQSAKAGTDQFTIRIYWLQAATGKQSSATITYNVTVVDQPY